MWEKLKQTVQTFQLLIGFILYIGAGIATGLGYGKLVAQDAGREAAEMYVSENQAAIVNELVGLNQTVRGIANSDAIQRCREIGPTQIPGPDYDEWESISPRAQYEWCEQEERYRKALWGKEDECKRVGIPLDECPMPEPEDVP